MSDDERLDLLLRGQRVLCAAVKTLLRRGDDARWPVLDDHIAELDEWLAPRHPPGPPREPARQPSPPATPEPGRGGTWTCDGCGATIDDLAWLDPTSAPAGWTWSTPTWSHTCATGAFRATRAPDPSACGVCGVTGGHTPACAEAPTAPRWIDTGRWVCRCLGAYDRVHPGRAEWSCVACWSRMPRGVGFADFRESVWWCHCSPQVHHARATAPTCPVCLEVAPPRLEYVGFWISATSWRCACDAEDSRDAPWGVHPARVDQCCRCRHVRPTQT